jgi:hypothetical protein
MSSVFSTRHWVPHDQDTIVEFRQ